MIFEYCSHETGREPRIRIWTSDMEAYGQFDVISWADFVALQEIGKRYNWTFNDRND